MNLCCRFVVAWVGWSFLGLSAWAEPSRLSVAESLDQITVANGPRVVLTYRKQAPELPPGVDPIYARSGFLHPVASPQGSVVTAAYPSDHAHQNGVFAAWVKTRYAGRDVDFWNLAKGQGRVRHNRVVETFSDSDRAGFVVELVHQIAGDPVTGEKFRNLLRETWRVTCFRVDDYHVFDLQSTQKAVTDEPLVVEQYHYGGLAVRGPAKWITSGNGRSTSNFLNSNGAGRIEGNHQAAEWVAMAGEQHGQAVSVVVLSDRHNFRFPQPARLHPTKPYFCFAPCVSGKFEIDRTHPIRFRYRFLIVDALPDAAWIDSQCEEWQREIEKAATR